MAETRSIENLGVAIGSHGCDVDVHILVVRHASVSYTNQRLPWRKVQQRKASSLSGLVSHNAPRVDVAIWLCMLPGTTEGSDLANDGHGGGGCVVAS